jgi:hypothetical protein
LLLADYLPELVSVSISERHTISDHCLDVIKKLETIAPEEYVKFSFRCLYTRYLDTSHLEFLKLNKRVNDIQIKYISISPTGTDGGEIYRASAQLRMHRRLKGIGIYYNLNEAWKQNWKAEQFGPVQIPPLINKFSGTDIYETFFHKSKFYLTQGIENNDKAPILEAITIWKTKINDIEFLEEIGGDPKFNERLIENRAIYKRMKNYLKVVEPCIKKTNWHSCIYDSEEIKI